MPIRASPSPEKLAPDKLILRLKTPTSVDLGWSCYDTPVDQLFDSRRANPKNQQNRMFCRIGISPCPTPQIFSNTLNAILLEYKTSLSARESDHNGNNDFVYFHVQRTILFKNGDQAQRVRAFSYYIQTF
jgi:hypothetical protein